MKKERNVKYYERSITTDDLFDFFKENENELFGCLVGFRYGNNEIIEVLTFEYNFESKTLDLIPNQNILEDPSDNFADLLYTEEFQITPENTVITADTPSGGWTTFSAIDVVDIDNVTYVVLVG